MASGLLQCVGHQQHFAVSITPHPNSFSDIATAHASMQHNLLQQINTCARHMCCRHTLFVTCKDLGYKLPLGWYRSACARQSMLAASSLVVIMAAVCKCSKQHCKSVDWQPSNRGLCQSLLYFLRRLLASFLWWRLSSKSRIFSLLASSTESLQHTYGTEWQQIRRDV